MILLTGASGFLGQSVQKVLRAQGLEFRTWDGDINDFFGLRNTLVDVRIVIHLAGAEAHGRKRLLGRVDVDGTDTLIKAIRFTSLDHLIVVSRINAALHSHYLLLRAKGEVERMVRESELPYTIVRCATLFGKEDRLTNGIATTAWWSRPFVWLPNAGRVAMQPLWVEDAARCVVGCIGRNDLLNRTIEVAGDRRLHYRDIAQMVLQAANIRRRPLSVRPRIARDVCRITSWLFRKPPRTLFDHDRVSVPEIADLDTVVTHFGFRPAQLSHHLSHLRRKGIARRLWRM